MAKKGRTRTCGRVEATARLNQAYEFADLATLDAGSTYGPTRSAAVSNAVPAGIAASDAICCLALGERAGGADHNAAVDLLASVPRVGPDASKYLAGLLGVKNAAQYLADDPNMAETKRSIRSMRSLLDVAASYVGG